MLEGSIVALVTPMKAGGAVDWIALEKLLEWHLENGTHGIVPMGTTGESATLDTDEHLKVIKRTIEVVGGEFLSLQAQEVTRPPRPFIKRRGRESWR